MYAERCVTTIADYRVHSCAGGCRFKLESPRDSLRQYNLGPAGRGVSRQVQEVSPKTLGPANFARLATVLTQTLLTPSVLMKAIEDPSRVPRTPRVPQQSPDGDKGQKDRGKGPLSTSSRAPLQGTIEVSPTSVSREGPLEELSSSRSTVTSMLSRAGRISEERCSALTQSWLAPEILQFLPHFLVTSPPKLWTQGKSNFRPAGAPRQGFKGHLSARIHPQRVMLQWRRDAVNGASKSEEKRPTSEVSLGLFQL